MMEQRRVRLAFLLGRLLRGGAELQMVALAQRLVARGFSIDFVARAGPGDLDERAHAAGAVIHPIGSPSSADSSILVWRYRQLGTYARWIRTARRQQYDIVDAWLHPDDVVAAMTRRLAGTPVVMSARLGRSARRRIGPSTRLFEWIVHRQIDVVVANAEITAADAIHNQRVPAERVRIIRGGVELVDASGPEDRRTQRAILGAGDEHILIGCVGNFRTMKRQDLLIDAFARLVVDHPNLRLALIGDGELRPQIERQILGLGLAGHVRLHGTATDLPPIYSALDLFVQASNSEGLPNVLLEAASSTLAIVATDAGGSREVIHDGETGLLVPIDDIDALASAIRIAVEDAMLRRRLAAAARTLIEREYGMDRFAREYEDLYREQLETKSTFRGR